MDTVTIPIYENCTRHHSFFIRFTEHFMRNHSDIEDIAQEVLPRACSIRE